MKIILNHYLNIIAIINFNRLNEPKLYHQFKISFDYLLNLSFIRKILIYIYLSNLFRKNHARAMDSMQASLESEQRAKAEALRYTF